MSIEWSYVTGHASQILPYLRQRLNGYMANWSDIYVGASSGPETRWEEHRHYEWEKMVILYHTSSAHYARWVERNLIAHSRLARYAIASHNDGVGGEGIRDGHSDYYVYVLLW